jgi:tetratricopeptide (TPR) repeat protein
MRKGFSSSSISLASKSNFLCGKRRASVWRNQISVAVTAAILLCSANGFGQTLAQGKALFDSGDYLEAVHIFESVRTSGAETERPEAAAFELRSYSQAGQHDDLLAKYDAALASAEGTPFEAEVEFEKAKSTQINAKDTTSALMQYNSIISRYSENVFAASGALYQRGTVELETLKTPSAADSSFEQVVTQYTSSPFVDDALLGVAKCGTALGQPDKIESARQQLVAMNASQSILQKVQLESGEFQNRYKGDRYAALGEYWKVFNDFTTPTEAAALARIRFADLVPDGNFRRATREYETVLSENPNLRKELRDWCKCQIAIFKFQVEDETGASEAFESLLQEIAERFIFGSC